MALVVQLRSSAYIVTDLLIAGMYLCLTHAFLPALGLQAATAAYAMTYVATLVLLILLIERHGDAR